ncbi:MAG: MIP/aquaporin family protein [Candidatus Methylumidiphilus sp.]
MKKYVVELVGTFFFVLTIGCVVIGGGAGPVAPLAIGSALMVMVYAGGHISGGHYNPAVTLGVMLRGRCPLNEAPIYMAAQLFGSALAALVVKYLEANAKAPVPMALDFGPALLAEFLFTFALVWVVLNSATAKGTAGNSFYGLAIGFTVLIGAFAVGNISGGAFNPAVALGIAILNITELANIWVYWAPEFLAGAAAAFTFKWINAEDI